MGAGDRLGGGGGKYVPPNQRGKTKDSGDSMMSSRMQQGFFCSHICLLSSKRQPRHSYHANRISVSMVSTLVSLILQWAAMES